MLKVEFHILRNLFFYSNLLLQLVTYMEGLLAMKITAASGKCFEGLHWKNQETLDLVLFPSRAMLIHQPSVTLKWKGN